MSNTITPNKYISTGLDYANGETAFMYTDSIASTVENSTAVNFWSYDLPTKKLTVRYKSSPMFYCYEGVPIQVIFALMLADSLGAFIAKEVKPNYSVA